LVHPASAVRVICAVQEEKESGLVVLHCQNAQAHKS
jgi:hypothetical protein